jgi:hypothetical protein
LTWYAHAVTKRSTRALLKPETEETVDLSVVCMWISATQRLPLHRESVLAHRE